MTKAEVIKNNYDEIIKTMVVLRRDVLEHDGRNQHQIYIWEDGEIRVLEGSQGDNSYLVPNNGESRNLYYVCTVDAPFFSPWDYVDETPPEDESQCEMVEQQVIDFLMDEYKEDIVYEILDSVIKEAKTWEELEQEEKHYA